MKYICIDIGWGYGKPNDKSFYLTKGTYERTWWNYVNYIKGFGISTKGGSKERYKFEKYKEDRSKGRGYRFWMSVGRKQPGEYYICINKLQNKGRRLWIGAKGKDIEIKSKKYREWEEE